MRMVKVLRCVIIGAASGLIFAWPCDAALIVDGSVTLESDSGLYNYRYVVSGVDVGRKVTGINWVMIEGFGAPQPEFLPLSWSVPFFWDLKPGHDGPVPGGVWLSTTDNRHALLFGKMSYPRFDGHLKTGVAQCVPRIPH